jgi:hypothetical protein
MGYAVKLQKKSGGKITNSNISMMYYNISKSSYSGTYTFINKGLYIVTFIGMNSGQITNTSSGATIIGTSNDTNGSRTIYTYIIYANTNASITYSCSTYSSLNMSTAIFYIEKYNYGILQYNRSVYADSAGLTLTSNSININTFVYVCEQSGSTGTPTIPTITSTKEPLSNIIEDSSNNLNGSRYAYKAGIYGGTITATCPRSSAGWSSGGILFVILIYQ